MKVVKLAGVASTGDLSEEGESITLFLAILLIVMNLGSRVAASAEDVDANLVRT